MKKFYTIILLCALSLIPAMAQLSVHHEAIQRIDPAVSRLAQAQLGSFRTAYAADESAVQDPKTLTNLPVDSAIYHQNFNDSPAGNTITHATILYADIVQYFKGNTIKKIRTIVPSGASEVTLYIADANDPTNYLFQQRVDDCERDVVVDLPCDYTINDCLNLLVGYTMHYTEDSKVWVPVVPCNRNGAWLQQDFSTGKEGYYDYTYMRYFLYGDPHVCYGAYINCITEGEGGFKPYDIVLEGVSHTRNFIGEKSNFSIGLTNYGTAKLPSTKLHCTLGDASQDINYDQPIGFLYYAYIESSLPTPTTPVRVPLTVQIVEVGGSPVDADIAESNGSITAVDPKLSVARKTVMEEFTGTWCGWCPRGARSIELMLKKHPESFIPIAIHSGDQFESEDFKDIIQNYAGNGFPSCAINRLATGDPYSGSTNLGIEKDLTYVSELPCEATVTLNSAQLSDDLSTVFVNTSTTFSIDCKTAPYRLDFVLTEDGQKAVQTNYYPITYGDKPNDVPEELRDLVSLGSKYMAEMNHVARYLSSQNGVDGTLDAPIVKDETQQHSFELKVPLSVSYLDKLHVVALLIDNGSGEILNAATLPVAVTDGIHAASTDAADISARDGQLSIHHFNGEVSIFNAAGQRIAHSRLDGSAQFHLAPGCYVVRTENAQGVSSTKIVF